MAKPKAIKPIKTIPTRAHPLVQCIFRAMNDQNVTYQELSERSGVTKKVLERWRLNCTPQLVTLELVLKALGLKLVIEDGNDRRRGAT